MSNQNQGNGGRLVLAAGSLFGKKVMLIVLPFLLIFLLPMCSMVPDASTPGYTEEQIEIFKRVEGSKDIPYVELMVYHYIRQKEDVTRSEITNLAERFHYKKKKKKRSCDSDGNCKTKTYYVDAIYSLKERLEKDGYSSEEIEAALNLKSMWEVLFSDVAEIEIPDNIPAPVVEGSNGWMWPTPSTRITSGYGYRSCSGCSSFHDAVDVGAINRGVAGDPVWAMEDGIVTYSGLITNGGNSVFIDHGNGVVSRYIHLYSRVVDVGQIVSKGEVIGLMGGTGGTRTRLDYNAYGVHLDFQIKVFGKAVDPLYYFDL